ncbi:hypothetical protein SFUMM280S_05034 [Streptomyces fumanus]
MHAQAERLGAQVRRPRGERGGDEGAQHGDTGGEPDPAEGEMVRPLRVQPREKTSLKKILYMVSSGCLTGGGRLMGAA